MNRYIYLIGIFIIINSFACEQKPDVFTPEFKENIQSRVDNDIITGIVVGVVTPEGTSYYNYGVKSYDTQEPVDENTVFEIGSNTKTFTGLLLANEVLKGKLNLDDPIQKLLPEGITSPTRNGEEIRLVNLATHTSSLPRIPHIQNPNSPHGPFANLTFDDIYNFLNDYELKHDIGTHWEYSNLGTGLLGLIIAGKYNTDYESMLINEISSPLGMTDTRIECTPEMEKRAAKGHSMGNEVDKYYLPAIAGAGAIRSTAVDMIKYLKANMGLEKTDLCEAMQLSHKNTGRGNEHVKMGLGWIIMDVEGEEVIWHDGGTKGQMSFMGFNKSRNIGVVVLTNSTGFPDDIGFHLLNPLYKLANPKISIVTKLNRIIKDKGVNAAKEFYNEIKTNNIEEYSSKANDFVRLGYYYLQKGKIEEALFIFKINVDTYPEDWNANDCYGEALLKNGEEEKAIEYYKKSVELNPDNTAGINALKKLGVEI